MIVVAPTQSGKTTGLAIPALLEWQGPVVATSIKSDLLRRQRRPPPGARRGDGLRPRPGRPGWPSTRATPLQSCRHLARGDAGRPLAGELGAGGQRRPADSEFWYSTAEKLLAPLLFAAAGERRDDGVGGALARRRGRRPATPRSSELLEARRIARRRERAWQATQNREERQRSSVFTTAEMILAAFADPRVIEETVGADYTPARLLDGGMNTLYLCAPRHEQERLRTLFATMISELLAVVYESAAATGRPIDPPLLLVLDEAANIAPIPNLDEVASTGAGQGVQLLSVFQDLAQVRSRYGDRAQTIVNNHRAKLFGTGISDPETLALRQSQVVGAGEFEQRTHSERRAGQHHQYQNVP